MKILFLYLAFFYSLSAFAHQQDHQYVPSNTQVTFAKIKPVVFIDEAHNNFHTMDGRYKPFADVLASDGYQVRKNTQLITTESLKTADVLVIANALSIKNVENWDLPNHSAFTRKEIEAIYKWVQQGGALFLIADHMPFPKATESLAAIFGFQFNNGYAEDTVNENSKFIYTFSKEQRTDHPILMGMNDSEKIASVKTFTGQAFLPPLGAKTILTLPENVVTLMPSKSWHFNDSTPRFSVSGWSQGATLEFKKGRIAIFGEAAMFTSQYVDREDKTRDPWVGLKAKEAKDNEHFLLNIMHWLSFKI